MKMKACSTVCHDTLVVSAANTGVKTRRKHAAVDQRAAVTGPLRAAAALLL